MPGVLAGGVAMLHVPPLRVRVPSLGGGWCGAVGGAPTVSGGRGGGRRGTGRGRAGGQTRARVGSRVLVPEIQSGHTLSSIPPPAGRPVLVLPRGAELPTAGNTPGTGNALLPLGARKQRGRVLVRDLEPEAVQRHTRGGI